MLAKLHYESPYSPPRKAFDFYTALALSTYMTSRDVPPARERRLFYSDEYGLTLVSEADHWEDTLASYVSRIDTKVDPADSDFIKTKKEYFQREISIMRTLPPLPKLEVRCHMATPLSLPCSVCRRSVCSYRRLASCSSGSRP
jgi:hypothetical protein